MHVLMRTGSLQTLAGYTNDAGHKTLIANTELTPAGIILDAELTLPTPERLWLSTGLRALDHAVGASPSSLLLRFSFCGWWLVWVR